MTPIRSFLNRNVDDFESHDSRRNFYFDDVADLFPQQSLCDGSARSDFPFFEVCFALGYDGIFHRHIVFGVSYFYTVQYLYCMRVQFRVIDNTGIGHFVFELRNFHFEQPLSLFGRVVFCIFRQWNQAKRMNRQHCGK